MARNFNVRASLSESEKNQLCCRKLPSEQSLQPFRPMPWFEAYFQERNDAVFLVCRSKKRELALLQGTSGVERIATFSTNEVPWFWAHYQEFVGVKENKKGVKKRIKFIANSHWSREGCNIFDQWGALIMSTLQRVKWWCKFFRSFCPKRHEWHKWHLCKVFLGLGILFKN